LTRPLEAVSTALGAEIGNFGLWHSFQPSVGYIWEKLSAALLLHRYDNNYKVLFFKVFIKDWLENRRFDH
jgi:hypothetical protein